MVCPHRREIYQCILRAIGSEKPTNRVHGSIHKIRLARQTVIFQMIDSAAFEMARTPGWACRSASASHILTKISESLFDIANVVNRSEQILLTRQQQPRPRGDDRERTTRARQVAEALFASKPVTSPSVPQTVTDDQAVRKPRVLGIIPPSRSTRQDQPPSPVAPAPPTVEIPRSQFPRIRTWIKYGMSVAQVAQVYGVSASEIERIFGKA